MIKDLVKNWFEVSEERATEVAEIAEADYEAIKERLKNYTEKETPFEQVVADFDGFNVEGTSCFDLEFDDIILTVSYENGCYYPSKDISLFIPNKNDVEPLNIVLD